MIAENVNPLLTETVIPLTEAAADFGGIAIPLATVRKYAYRGVQGLKLESVSINGRYTSKEAIQRFIERKQNLGQPQAKPKVKRLTQPQDYQNHYPHRQCPANRNVGTPNGKRVEAGVKSGHTRKVPPHRGVWGGFVGVTFRTMYLLVL